ncbi:MAG: hypothetical protein NUV65_03050 [Candidatus Roizmanbacteria bacterium]|nr:hypothetical protein [Candidatus Roizmanbacteria bacterium]
MEQPIQQKQNSIKDDPFFRKHMVLLAQKYNTKRSVVSYIILRYNKGMGLKEMTMETVKRLNTKNNSSSKNHFRYIIHFLAKLSLSSFLTLYEDYLFIKNNVPILLSTRGRTRDTSIKKSLTTRLPLKRMNQGTFT